MKKLFTGIFVICGLIVVLAISFIFYAQFALDYSLENLREALVLSSQTGTQESVSGLGSRAVSAGLESMVLEEISYKDADFQTVTLLEHASRSLGEAIQQSGYTQAGVYLAEVLKERVPRRNFALQVTDAVFHFLKNLLKSVQDVLGYALRRIRKLPEEEPLAQTGVLILAEAEKMEKGWKLQEAERYYREFLDRYPDRVERGFVKISLAHILIKQQRLKEAKEILEGVQKGFLGGRESTIASNLIERIRAIQKHLNRIPELENWIKSSPNRFFTEEGGLELALSYLATYQIDLALSTLQQLSKAPDPRLRTKALFYQGWIRKWQGDLEQGMALFQMLRKEPGVDQQLAMATVAQIAETHYRKKEYKQAIATYEELSRQAAGETWRSLAELEGVTLNVFGLGDLDAARKQFQNLETLFPTGSADLELLRKKFQEALDKGLRAEGFKELARGKVASALTLLENYLKKYPRDGTALSALASIDLIRGNLNEALLHAQRGFELERTEYTATVYGYVYEKMEKLDEASHYYDIALQIKPTYLTARFNRSWVYLKTVKYQEAEELLSELENDREGLVEIIQAKILNNHGCALWGLGRTEEALTRFREALKVSPDFTEAKQNLNLAAGQRPVAAVI